MTSIQSAGIQINLPTVGKVERRVDSLENEVLIIEDTRHFSSASVVVRYNTLRKDYEMVLPQLGSEGRGDFKGALAIPHKEEVFTAFVLGIINDQEVQRLAYATSGTLPTQYESGWPPDKRYPTIGFPVIKTISLDDIRYFKEIESREAIGDEYELR